MNKIWLPIIFAVIGYFVSTKIFVRLLSNVTPIEGLAIYYIAVMSSILALEYLGLVIAGIRFKSFKQFLGTLLLNFAIFIVIIWENCYTAERIKGRCTGFNSIYLNTESGATYYFWSKFIKDQRTKRILTFMVTPFVLSLMGLILIHSD